MTAAMMQLGEQGRNVTDQNSGLIWQVGVWDSISKMYWDEIDARFASVVDAVLERAGLRPGEHVLDVGTGTGAVAAGAVAAVAPGGDVVAMDISLEMLALAKRRAQDGGLRYLVKEGRAEAIPARNAQFDVVVASLSLMYVVDRAAAAHEIARVLRPGGRLVASVWAGPELCDIVLFQQTAGRYAPPPPVAGVGPGALADPQPFLNQLAESGIEARVESEVHDFDFPNFALAWDVLAGVTTAQLSVELRDEAQAAVQAAMWPNPDQPRHFRNTTQLIVGARR
jgi:SAM-dependent methyltransferase